MATDRAFRLYQVIPQKSSCCSVLNIIIKWRAFWISKISYEGFIFYDKWYSKMFSHPAGLKKTWFSVILL